ncbi:MAG TPA: CAP domain-containing protein [Drouetiella sp.]|jgi:uncharacterized protein YkwD
MKNQNSLESIVAAAPMSTVAAAPMSTIAAALMSIALQFFCLCTIAEAQPKSFAYRTSSTQTFSTTLGVNCVPAYVLINKIANQGIFIVSAPTAELGKKMNLSPGTVLLTVDNYSMISAKAVDSWLSHRSKRGPISFTYATDNNGKALVQSGSVQADSASASAPPGSSSSSKSSSSAASHGIASRDVLSMPMGGSGGGGGIAPYLLTLINGSRVAGGLSQLQSDSSLARYAQSYADYLAANASKYDVKDPNNNPHQDLNGRGALERAQQAGITNFANENIGRNVGNLGIAGVKVLHQQMMDSPGHRPAIMDSEAHLVGIGAAYAGNRLFLVEEFGK